MRFLDRDQIEATGRWILAHQSGEGEIPWWRGAKADPWDHVFGAMGLTIAGFHEEAVKAFQFLEQTQSPDGAWPAWRKNGEVTDDTQDTNQAAFIATGAWYYYTATGDGAFLRDLWPTIERAIDFCVGMQADDGSISWGMAGDGGVWDSPLLTGSSSVFGSFVCAERIAAQLVSLPAILGVDCSKTAEGSLHAVVSDSFVDCHKSGRTHHVGVQYYGEL